jgi:hypothetical protein
MATSQTNSTAAQQAINDQNVYIRDTLMSIAAKYAETLKDAVEDAFDSAEAGTLNAVGKDLTRSFTKLAKMSDDFANNQSRIKKGVLDQKGVEKQIIEIQEKREALLRKIEHAKRLGLEISEADLQAALKSLEVQEQMLENDKKLAKSLSFKIALQKTYNDIQQKFNIAQLTELFTLAGIMKTIINGALQFNKTSVEIGKNFGYGTEQANRLTGELNSMARSSTNVNVTLKSLTEAMNDLNTATGFVTEYSQETLETQVMLTKQLGLTGDEAAGFYKYSVLTGKTSKETYNTVKNSFVAMRNQLGVGIPFKAVMAEVAKTSGAIAANLGFSPKRIAEAVTQAKALGTSLEQTKGQAESLLDFETSIEKELQAELITGQSLNLERARAFALTGDLAGVAEELANQGMTAASFGEMNAIAQKDYAAALGLTSDQLSDQLQKRELAIKSGKSLAQLEAEQADEAAKRQTVQDKFNAAIEKLQALVGGLVAGPFGALLDLITKILDQTWLLSAAMGFYIGKLIFGIALKRTELALSKKNAQSTAVEASAETSKQAAKVPVIGWALAITAGLATFAALSGLFSKSMDDGIMSPSGKILYSGAEGAIRLNDNDTIVAGTNLNRGGGGGGNSMEVVSAIRDMHNEMKQSNSKPAVAVINGKDAFADSVGKSSALGTSQTINNSYKLA